MKDKNTASIIPWDEIHRRLETFEAILERAFTPGPEEKKKILKARAQALARESEKKLEGEQYLEVVEFLLAYERYGMESAFVREIYPLKELTPLPGTPPFVLGILSVRGQIRSVMDFRKFFDLPEKGLTDLNKVILIGNEEMEVGVLADAVFGVQSIPLREIQPPLPTLTGIQEEYLRGITAGRLIVLDVQRILSDRNIIVNQQVEP